MGSLFDDQDHFSHDAHVFFYRDMMDKCQSILTYRCEQKNLLISFDNIHNFFSSYPIHK